jgi:hypothetical protein
MVFKINDQKTLTLIYTLFSTTWLTKISSVVIHGLELEDILVTCMKWGNILVIFQVPCIKWYPLHKVSTSRGQLYDFGCLSLWGFFNWFAIFVFIKKKKKTVYSHFQVLFTLEYCAKLLLFLLCKIYFGSQ